MRQILTFLGNNWFKVSILTLSAIFLLSLIYLTYTILIENPKIAEQQECTQEIAQMDNLDKCLDAASANYNLNWASECASNLQSEFDGYKSCRELEDATFCTSLWGEDAASDTYSADCSLPETASEVLNSQFKDDTDNCYKEYPQSQ